MAAAAHTFLFTDIVGFTALTATRGDDEAAEVALDFYRRVRPLLPEHRAQEVKTLGDALMLRAEDPGLAVRLGLEIVDSLGGRPGDPVVRVGMHTGPAVERDGDWYGSTVNLAARLCHVADGGEVLVSETTTTAAAVLRGVQLESPRVYRLKNVAQPLAARPVRRAACGARMRSLGATLGQLAARAGTAGAVSAGEPAR
ncbi:MAG: adenylate cyclase [Solirubrobacteraceae bacterium]|jgi:class 3 adenylate cyclase|nr:adenylate cyclase [Solirubrobacteraceae bacterium]